MKKAMRFICVLLVMSLLFAFPVSAETSENTRASAYFSSYGTDLYKTGEKSFQVWFDVNSNAEYMDVIGVSEIVIYRSADMQTWTRMRGYTMDRYPEMTATNDYAHTGYVTYNLATAGYYYTALVTFYSRDSSGFGERDVYTEIIQM